MRRDLLLLGEMIDAIEQIQRLVADGADDEMTLPREHRDSLLWNYTVLGEAAVQVSDQVKMIVQLLCIAYAILIDDHTEPVFPRWAGYLNIWVAVLLIPAGLVAFFKSDPFAWNGVFGFYIPLVCFAIWLSAMTYLMWTATAKEEAAFQANTAMGTEHVAA